MTTALHLTDYERRHREDILSLLFYSRFTHTHLDWFKAGQWLDIDGSSIQLAYNGNDLVGVLGVSEPLNRAAWLRMVAVGQGYDPAIILSMLWEEQRLRLKALGVDKVAVLVVNPWFNAYLPAMGFHYMEEVVTLHRAPQVLPPANPGPLNFRNGYIEDISEIVAIDHAAFDAPWQLGATDIRFAQRQAASCTLAEYEGKVVAYELSTRHQSAGHLARLAVHPKMQGQKVGYLLLHNLLSRFEKRGVRTMTVNTQMSNIHSQRLYNRFGFFRNGFDLPIWQANLS
jgi:[ribosomal protein S18]-alanine N-acetyltransferase